jgi:hypothetical protein
VNAVAQTNQEQGILAEYEKNQTGIVSRSQYSLAIAYTPSGNDIPPGGVSAKEFDSSKPIYFQVYSTTNKPFVFFILQPQYGFRFSMSSESGEVVMPSRKGAKYGSNFDNLKIFDADYIDTAGRRYPYWNVTARVDFPEVGKRIPPPDDLFDFKKPGKYIMTIEAACFASRYYPPHPGDQSTNYYLVKFPSVRLTVVKKEKE